MRELLNWVLAGREEFLMRHNADPAAHVLVCYPPEMSMDGWSELVILCPKERIESGEPLPPEEAKALYPWSLVRVGNAC